MPLYSADALILRTYKLGDADRIVVFLTKDRGKKRGVAKGARRHRSRFTGSLEPMTRAGIAYFEKERRELVSLNYVEVQRSPLASGSSEALIHAGYFADLIDQWAADADPNERLYRLGAAVVDALGTEIPIRLLSCYFEYWLLRLQGVYPSHLSCHECGRSLVATGAYLRRGDRVLTCGLCSSDSAAQRLGTEALDFLRTASRATPTELSATALSAEAASDLEAVHMNLMTIHLEKPLRSIQVVREVSDGRK